MWQILLIYFHQTTFKVMIIMDNDFFQTEINIDVKMFETPDHGNININT